MAFGGESIGGKDAGMVAGGLSAAIGESVAAFREATPSSEILGQKGRAQTTASMANSTATTQWTANRRTGCRTDRRAAAATSIKSVASR